MGKILKSLQNISANSKQIKYMFDNVNFTILQSVPNTTTNLDIPYKMCHKIWVKERYSPGYEHCDGESSIDGLAKVEVIYPTNQEVRIVPSTYELAEHWDRTYSEDGFDEPMIFPASTMTDNLSRLELMIVDSHIIDIPNIETLTGWRKNNNIKVVGSFLKPNIKCCKIFCHVVHKPVDLQSDWVKRWYAKHPNTELIEMDRRIKEDEERWSEDTCPIFIKSGKMPDEK